MSTRADAPALAPRNAALPATAPPPRFGHVVVWCIVGLQAVWLGVLMARGWYYQDDLAFLAQARGRSLGPEYLTDPVNDHLSPGLRLVFWMLQPLGAGAYWVTIVARLLLQAIATLLLYRLMVRLVGPSRLVIGVLAGYAFSPMLLGMAWLSCAANVLPAQVLVLAGYLAHLDYLRSGRLRSAAAAGLAFAAAATFLELSAINAVLLVPLALGFVYEGSVRGRLRAFGREWLGWLLAGGPLAVFGVAYLAGGYGGSARYVGGETLLRLLWEQWSHTVAPLGLGGPWAWHSSDGVYFSSTHPPAWGVWAAQAVVVLAVVASVAQVGRRALVAWSLPVGFVVLCSTVLAVGRFSQFGYLSAREITYAFGAALPTALAVVLAFSGGRPSDGRDGPRHRSTSRWTRPLPYAALVAVLAGAVVTDQRFVDRWSANPTRPYLDTLTADLAAQPGVHLFDTPLPLHVLPYIEPNRYLSDIVPLLPHQASFDAGDHGRVVDAHGHVVPATFLPVAEIDPGAPDAFCPHLVSGRTDQVLPLTKTPRRNEWFLRLDYFQQHASVVHVWLVGSDGQRIQPVEGSRVLLASTLATRYLRFGSVRPTAVRVRSESPATNLCLTTAEVGYPFPRRAHS